jgi:two-component system sensor kinase FixL
MDESPATAVLSLDRGNEIVGLSRELEWLLGWRAEDLLGEPVAKIFASPVDCSSAALSSSGPSRPMTGLRPDGATLPVRVAARGWESSEGQFVTLSITASGGADALAKARSAEERFDALLDASPDGIVVTDREGRVEIFNAAAERLFGLGEREVVGRSLLELLPGVTRDVARKNLPRVLSDLRRDLAVGPREFMARRRDGSLFPVELSIGQTGDTGSDSYIAVVRDVTRRHRAAAELARSEANLRMSQALAHLGSFEVLYPSDDDGYFSDEVFRIMGRDPALGMPPLDALIDELVHPEDLAEVTAAIRAALGTGGLLELSYRIMRPDGNLRHVKTAARVTSGLEPDTWRISGTVLDVTETQRIETALRQERDRAETYLNLVGVMVVALDLQGNIELINREGLETLGHTEDEVIGRSFFQLFVPEEHRGAAFARYRESLADDAGPSPLQVGWVLTKDGDRRRVQWRNQALRDAGDRIVGLLGAGQDITEQHRTGVQLQQAEEELRLTFRHAPIGMATVDLAGNILSVNQSLCSMLGCGEKELLGAGLDDLAHPEDRHVGDGLRRRLLTGEVEYVREEKRYLRADGSTVYGVVRCSLVKDPRDRPLMIVAQIVDRTEQMLAEMEVRQHRERLVQVSRLGTMGEMAAGIAHELNQPLTAISNYSKACQRLLDQAAIEPAELKEILAKISAQARRAGQVIHGLRSFAKQRTVERRPIEIERLLSEVFMLAEMDTRSHGIPLVLQAPASLPRVQADPIQLQQVLLNLIRNAVDAMDDLPDKHRGIVVRATVTADDEVELAVVDHGPGIAPEHRPQLLNPFFTTKEDGLGIGLSFSRSIVEAHGGRLGFRENPAGGSTFLVTLPTLPEQPS